MKVGLPDKKRCILKRLDKLTKDTKPRWGRMNAAQMLKHLSLDFQSAMGEYPMQDVSNFISRQVLKRLILSDIKFPERPGPETLAEINMADNNIPYGDFTTEKQSIINTMNRFIGANKFPDKHPKLGKFTQEEWYRYAFRHIDYHFNQFGV